MNAHPHTSTTPRRRTTRLIKSASGPIATPKIHPPITKQSQFPAATSQNFITKPENSPHPAANPHRISKRLSKNPEILGFDIAKCRVRWPFSQVRWPHNRPYEPGEPDQTRSRPRVTFSPHQTPLIHVHRRATLPHPINLNCKWPLAPRKHRFPGESKTECSTCVDS